VIKGCLPVGSGERHTGSVEVIGSIPTVSTKKPASFWLAGFNYIRTFTRQE